MCDFSKACDAEMFFRNTLNEIKNVKVKAIFSLSPGFYRYKNLTRIYSTDVPIYILFENEMCLIIDYPFIDELHIQFRKMTSEEISACHYGALTDCFHNVNSHGEDIEQIASIALEYDSINEILVHRFSRDYSKWIDNDVKITAAGKETFDEIKFTMDNGRGFTVCADDAEADGYTLIWATDAEAIIGELDE
jgi:hypothetical protein